MARRLATVISLVFDPRLVVPVMLTLAFWWGYRNGMALLFLGLLLFIDGLLPFLFYLSLKRSGVISDWEIRRREERIPLYSFVVVAHLGGVGLAIFSKQLADRSVRVRFEPTVRLSAKNERRYAKMTEDFKRGRNVKTFETVKDLMRDLAS